MKVKLILLLKFLAFVICYFIVITIADMLFPSSIEVEPSTNLFLALFAQIAVNSIAIIYLIKKLSLRGIKLIFTTAIIVYGLQIFMTQIETWIFIEAFPTFDLRELKLVFISNLISFLTLCGIAFLIFRPKHDDSSINDSKLIDKTWLYKLVGLSVTYMLLYVLFGTIIAWQSAELREFYATSVNNMSFLELKLIQIVRGFLWVLLVIPVALWLKASRKEKIISSALLLALLPTIVLFFPNPFMPFNVRLVHFAEVFISNGIFGLITAFILTMPIRKKV